MKSKNENFAFDITKEYPQEFYDEYIKNFENKGKKSIIFRFFKRSFDMIMSSLMLVILSPLFLIIALAIIIDDPKGHVFFVQKRMGRGGKTFRCIKFRSMKTNAPHDVATSRLEHAGNYQTKVGNLLRKLSLDELPQLYCVFIGTMSFIGYRPLCLTEENCNNMRKALNVFSMRPGISGLAQVNGRDDLCYKNKALLDAEYVKHASVWLDIKLMFKTVGTVLFRKGNKDDEEEKIEKQASQEKQEKLGVQEKSAEKQLEE